MMGGFSPCAPRISSSTSLDLSLLIWRVLMFITLRIMLLRDPCLATIATSSFLIIGSYFS